MRRKDVLAVVAAAASTLLVAGVVWFGQHSGAEPSAPAPTTPPTTVSAASPAVVSSPPVSVWVNPNTGEPVKTREDYDQWLAAEVHQAFETPSVYDCEVLDEFAATPGVLDAGELTRAALADIGASRGCVGGPES